MCTIVELLFEFYFFYTWCQNGKNKVFLKNNRDMTLQCVSHFLFYKSKFKFVVSSQQKLPEAIF